MDNLDIEKCTGCALCEYLCPTKAIKLTYSQNSCFFVPTVDETKCIHCGICEKNCQVNTEIKLNDSKSLLCAQSKDKNILSMSTSGGIATLISKEFVKHGGIVYGAAFDENMVVAHIRCTNVAEIKKISGSKYVQSSLSSIYRKIREDLEDDKSVLFIGTPCQCAGMKRAFENFERFYCCDFICNGVGSPKVFKEHITYLENIYRCKIYNYIFRPKQVHYLEPYECFIDIEGKVHRMKAPHKKWGTIYYEGIIFRASCYDCQYTKNERTGNITFSDIPLKIMEKGKNFDHEISKYGASLIGINDSKGNILFDYIKDSISFTIVNDELSYQKKHNLSERKNRDAFLADVQISYKKARKRKFGQIRHIKSILIDLGEKFKNS